MSDQTLNVLPGAIIGWLGFSGIFLVGFILTLVTHSAIKETGSTLLIGIGVPILVAIFIALIPFLAGDFARALMSFAAMCIEAVLGGLLGLAIGALHQTIKTAPPCHFPPRTLTI
ncbi:MAG: hypothetical protein NTX66_02325 [Candidatus Falkowbacteria bacterium]|nr:hypothetical protein [Candidatus Falkowbacteria bacterium]